MGDGVSRNYGLCIVIKNTDMQLRQVVFCSAFGELGKMQYATKSLVYLQDSAGESLRLEKGLVYTLKGGNEMVSVEILAVR